MAYKYRLTDSFGNGAYFNFDISPDFGMPIYNGDTITLTGEIYEREFTIKSILVFLGTSKTKGFSVVKNISVTKGKKTKISISYVINWDEWDGGDERIQLSTTDLDIQMFSLANGNGDDWFETLNNRSVPMKIAMYKYHLDLQVSSMDFVRTDATGKVADDGQYLCCKNFKITINADAKPEDITNATLQCSGSDGSLNSSQFSMRQIISALAEEGYVEDEPSIFTFISGLGNNYTIVLTIGDGYEQVVFSDSVLRAFANMHLSGAKTGGVAFGMFSTAVEDNPKLESAYPAHLYGGLGEETIKLISNVIYPVGSVFFCTDEITPSDVFGGKWEQIKDRFIVAAGSSYTEGATGGSASYSLSTSHRHTSPAGFAGGILGVVKINGSVNGGRGDSYASVDAGHTGNLGGDISLGYTGNATVSATIPTIPPYVAICVWKRIELYDVNADMTISNTMKSVRRLSHEQLEDK